MIYFKFKILTSKSRQYELANNFRIIKSILNLRGKYSSFWGFVWALSGIITYVLDLLLAVRFKPIIDSF